MVVLKAMSHTEALGWMYSTWKLPTCLWSVLAGDKMFWSSIRKIKLQHAWKGHEGYFNLCTPKFLSFRWVLRQPSHFISSRWYSHLSELATSVKGKPALNPSGEKLLGASDQTGYHLGTAWYRVPGSWGSMWLSGCSSWQSSLMESFSELPK